MRPTILAGLGGSGGWQALAWATDEAIASGSDLVLLHACPPDSHLAARAPSPPLSIVELFDPSLARAVATARARLGGDRVRFRLLPGRPGPLLTAAAARASLVVVGPPARRYPGGYGSTTHDVIAHAPVPVVVVRPVAADRDAPLRGLVVVGVDGRAGTDPALEFGFERAASHRCALAAVHVTAGQSEEPAAHDLVARAVEPWMLRYPQVSVRRAVHSGRPLPGLLRAARGARLLVVGDNGRGRLGPAGRALLGSVAHGAVDGATGPVSVVRAAEREPVATAAPRGAPTP